MACACAVCAIRALYTVRMGDASFMLLYCFLKCGRCSSCGCLFLSVIIPTFIHPQNDVTARLLIRLWDGLLRREPQKHWRVLLCSASQQEPRARSLVEMNRTLKAHLSRTGHRLLSQRTALATIPDRHLLHNTFKGCTMSTFAE
jgi:hypothetical protein